MATEYLTTDIDLKKVADGIRSRTGKTTPLAFPDGYVTEISTLTNTSDATAAASDIAKGETAYVKGAKVTGTADQFLNPIMSYDNTMSYSSTSKKVTINSKVLSNYGNIFVENDGRSPLMKLYVDADDFGNATSGNVLNGKTYTSAAGLAIAGTMPNNGAAAIQLSDLTAKSVTAGYYSGGTAKVADVEAAKIIPENIKKGVTILGVEGTMEAGYDTSDATVTAGDMSYGVVAYGKDGQVYGGVPTIDGNSEKALGDSMVGYHVGLGKIQLAQRIPRLGILFREGSTVILRASPSEFGDATAADVAKGKTFTSAAGLKVVGTAEGSSAADVTFEMYNHDFDNLAVVYISKTDGITQTTIPISSSMSITAIDGSMVALVDQDFGGNYIDLVPDNTNIPNAWVTQNVTLFVASAEIDGMISNVNRA